MAKRSKNFATIIYPESAPENFVDLIKEAKVSFLLSPLHDKDIAVDGNLKKPHYHLILIFDSLKSVDQVREVIAPFGGTGCEIVNSLVNYARYLCHFDDPDKAQYLLDDVISYGFDYSALIESKSDKYETMARIVDFCIETKCTSYARLLIYARYKDFSMFRALCDNSYAIREFLRSITQDVQDCNDNLDLEDSDDEWTYSGGFDTENPFSL